MSEKWDRFYLNLAEFVATRLSKDPSTKVGAVLVNYEHNREFLGYNGFPRGVKDDPERYNNRELKYKMVVHAEVNAILKAGDYARDSTLYVFPTFVIPPICCDCCKIAIQAGVKEIVGYEANDTDKERTNRKRSDGSSWADSIAVSKQMCDEAGIKYRTVEKIKYMDLSDLSKPLSVDPNASKPTEEELRKIYATP